MQAFKVPPPPNLLPPGEEGYLHLNRRAAREEGYLHLNRRAAREEGLRYPPVEPGEEKHLHLNRRATRGGGIPEPTGKV